MKKVVALLTGIVVSISSFSQFSFGIQGTGNLSDAQLKSSDLINLKKTARLMPGAGLVADINVTPGLLVRTGINYQQNGIEIKTSLDGIPGEIDEIKVSGKMNLHYVQVPLNVLFTTKGSLRFFVGGGPYASFAVKGKANQETTLKFSDGTTVTEKEESDVFEKDQDGNTSFKRFDYGVGAIAGIKFPGGLFANLGYQYSLSNISKNEGETYKNRGLQLTIGYYLFSR